MFYIITENQEHELSCQSVEIEAPPTINAVQPSTFNKLLENGKIIASLGAQEQKLTGDAFGFFSAFKFVKDSVNQVKDIMAAEPKREEKKKVRDTAIKEMGQKGMITGSQGETKSPTAPPRE